MFAAPILKEMAGLTPGSISHFLPFWLGPTARNTLQEFIDIDVTASDLVRILHQNQMYEGLFYRFVDQKQSPKPKEKKKVVKQEEKKPEEPPPPLKPLMGTHRLIGLLGLLGSRNLIVALRMHKAIEGKFPFNESGDLEIIASDYLKMALELEETFLRNKMDYSETAFAVGYYLDWCLRSQAKAKDKKLEAYFQEVSKRAIRTGIIAYLLAQSNPRLSPKQALMGGALAHTGKLHMALNYTSGDDNYADFEPQLDKNAAIPVLGKLLLEREFFGFSHEEIGAQSLHYFDVFKPLIPAVRYYREPYCLKGADQTNYALASVLWLADQMARTWRVPDEKDPIFGEWSAPFLLPLKFKKATLIETMKVAMNLK